MADEIITLVSKEYATGNFQSKLTEANEGDNIKITGEGDNLKISAEIPAQAKTTITTSDERVAVTETQTGYDLALNGSFIERGEYTELENTVDGHTASITALGGTVATVQEDVGTLNSTVTSLEHDVEGNKEAITDLENTVENKQDKLTASTGINLNNNTISVNTETVVVDSDLPVTAGAVNSRLNDYATTTQLNNKQDKLSAGTGINLNGSTISVNTASSVGTSTLPVTASAVNTKLSGYVNSVSSPDGSITVTKSGSSVTLKSKRWRPAVITCSWVHTVNTSIVEHCR